MVIEDVKPKEATKTVLKDDKKSKTKKKDNSAGAIESFMKKMHKADAPLPKPEIKPKLEEEVKKESSVPSATTKSNKAKVSQLPVAKSSSPKEILKYKAKELPAKINPESPLKANQNKEETKSQANPSPNKDPTSFLNVDSKEFVAPSKSFAEVLEQKACLSDNDAEVKDAPKKKKKQKRSNKNKRKN